jgi:23S rRNA (adenine2503-C2)-methyltransferase
MDGPSTVASLPSLLELDPEGLEQFVAGIGEPRYRAHQIWEWIYTRHASNFGAMTNLPKPLRERLAQTATIAPLTLATEIVSQSGDTLKRLYCLPDGQTIESVLMLYDKRRTLCISSQVGCGMGCTFCATGLGGLARNLTHGEIVAQVLDYARFLADPHALPAVDTPRPTTVTNIVLMGMGEPMHNYENVWAALRRLIDPNGFGLGARNITLSTVGLVPMIDRMADEGLQVGLAVSLHAATDELRSALVPINRRYAISELLAAVSRYTQKTHRRVTFEYALMRDMNDSPDMAELLGERLAPLLCHVNLIPLNPVPDSLFQPTSPENTERFAQILRGHGISTTVRQRRGIEINAGCGQLRQAASADEV